MKKKTKTLDTLVEDIYNKIGVLADGEHMELDEATIDKFGESMKIKQKHLTSIIR
jgi:mevalonate kinase